MATSPLKAAPQMTRDFVVDNVIKAGVKGFSPSQGWE